MEIKKLKDILEWADSWINGMKDGMTEEEFAEDEEVKAFEAVKKVVNETIERHSVYTNALNNDIVAKDAKIELLEKELDGRKAGYVALKTQMDDLKKEYEEITKSRDTWFETAGEHAETIRRDSEKINKLKDEIVRLNKCIMNKNESINTGNEAIINLRKEIGAHEEENKRLSERIVELKRSFNNLKEEMANRYITVETHNDICKTYEDHVDELKKHVKYLKKELNETCRTKEADLKNHNKRDMTLVDELAGKNEKIKGLAQEVEYYKNQERIRTDQLRATESKVDELWKRIEKLEEGGDDHGRAGFKKYIEWLIEEEEKAVPERFKARLNEEIEKIFTKEEETEVKDIPCGEDSIE